MNKENIVKVFALMVVLLVVASGIVFVLIQRDRNMQLTSPSVTEVQKPARVYTEEEKTKILQDLASRTPSSVTPLAKEAHIPTQVSSSTPSLSVKETQIRIQELKRVSASISTTGMSDAEKLRILNTLSSKVQ